MSVSLQARDVAARGRSARLVRFDLDVGAGVHAILGSALDGAGLALAVLAGGTSPTRGTITVDGADPREVSGRIAWAPRFAPRADPLRVDEFLRLALDIRAVASSPSPSPGALLDRWNLSALGDRKVTSLTADEAHLVDTVLALSSGASFVLLEEPFAGLDVSTCVRIAEAVEALAARGAVIVVATASRREAVRVGAFTHRLVRGVTMDAAGAARHASFLVTLAADDAGVIRTQAFTLAVADDDHVRSFDTGDGWVRVHGEDAAQLSHAIGRAAARAGVDISSLEAVDPES